VELPLMKLDERDGIAWIRFSREAERNVLDAVFLTSLETALAYCEQEHSVRVVVLAGDDKSFIVGADIARLAQADVAEALRICDQTLRAQERLADLPKPTIAAITGSAVGGGLEVALCCDFRIAAKHARFGLPEINLGIMPGCGGTQRLPRIVGWTRTVEMVLLGELVDAETALAMNMIHRTCEREELELEVEALARKLAAKPSTALRAAKAALRASQNIDLKSGLFLEQHHFSMLFGTPDQREGMAAFREKRTPRFDGTQAREGGGEHE
jgi:enoyl-CoA hydratase/carnithine racemase